MSYALQQSPSRRIGGVIFVGLLHLGILYALVTGLGRQAIEVLRQPLVTKIIEEVKPQADVPPPPPLKFAPPPPPYIPPPEVQIQAPASSNAIAVVTTVKPPEPVAAPPVQAVAPAAAPVRVPAVIDAGRSCRPPEYPAASRRSEEVGTVGLLFLIDAEGGVIESKVESSSGHSRLDEAALGALGRCKFKPGTVDGKPEQTWARLRYVWKLQ
jgi:protein TonB